MPVVSAAELADLALRLLQGAGVATAIAEPVVTHLVDANLAGVDSHGVIRIPGYLDYIAEGKIARDDRIERLSDFAATTLLDGHETFGPVVALRAVDIALEKAATFGISIVAARNSAHIGRLGDYVERIAAKGHIGYICCNAQGAGQLVAPWGGREARVATNPLAWGVPTGGAPMVIDMSTSASAEGKIRVKLHRGEPLPVGWAIDADGAPATDPARFYGPPWGAILPAGEHKGYGLALVVDALAGALSGGGCVRPLDYVHTPLNAFTLIAISVDAFGSRSDFTQAIDTMLAHVRSATPLQAGGRVLIPGEPERLERQRRLAEGIPIDDETWQRLTAARESGV